MDVPIIWIPTADVHISYRHPGGSFREMLDMWKERGWIKLYPSRNAHLVWWEEIGQGGVCLYDDDTDYRRFLMGNLEKSSRLTLYGNPKPPQENPGSTFHDGAAKAWSYWSRAPRLLESIARGKLPGYEERNSGLVFFGKNQNSVQTERRQTHDWSRAAMGSPGSRFHIADYGEPYLLAQDVYFETLGQSRFGLCLPGYGFKCHREIECMAMGCVPLVSEEVDMDSYANPPEAGKEYFRVSSPEHAALLAAELSQEKWEEMSAACHAWWVKNASCEGLFELTKKLIEAP
jgi:hypothetical protein